MKFKLKSKLGRPFWRFGVQFSPDSWKELDLTEEQLASIRTQCVLTVAEGGALEIQPNPFAKAEQAPAASLKDPPAKDPSKGR